MFEIFYRPWAWEDWYAFFGVVFLFGFMFFLFAVMLCGALYKGNR